MPCAYLGHIDLAAVYEQLPKYEPGFVTPALANIPPQLCDNLAVHFEWLAEAVIESFPGRPWQEWAPIDIAAAVGDLIEDHLDAATGDFDQFERSGTTIATFVSDLREWSGSDARYDYLVCLLVCQYDTLCSLYAGGDMESLLGVFESIAETRENLVHCFEVGTRGYLRSREARGRAEKRHAASNQLKAALLAEWDATCGEYDSRADFARIVSRRDGVLYRTLYDWIAVHERTKD